MSRHAELRDGADDGYIEAHLWTGIAHARSGCGAAIVGDPDQVVTKLRTYTFLGIDAYIICGYPLLAECDLVARCVLRVLRQDAGRRGCRDRSGGERGGNGVGGGADPSGVAVDVARPRPRRRFTMSAPSCGQTAPA